MATFLDLPNELKLNIIEVAALDDIGNFALCCKLVHGLALNTLRQHKADKWMYSAFVLALMSNTGYEENLTGFYKLLTSRRAGVFNSFLSWSSLRIIDHGSFTPFWTKMREELRASRVSK